MKTPDVTIALSRRSKERLKEKSDKVKADAAMKRVQEQHGDIIAKKDPMDKPTKEPKYSQEYLNAKSAYETAKEVGGASKEELRRLWREMKAAEKKN